jgi:hypothetical protein
MPLHVGKPGRSSILQSEQQFKESSIQTTLFFVSATDIQGQKSSTKEDLTTHNKKGKYFSMIFNSLETGPPGINSLNCW